jgi:hypothetical protein
MPGQYTLEKIENWASDFCLSDGLRPFTPALRDAAGQLLVAFLTAACDARGVEPGDIEEPDIKAALLGSVARLAVPEAIRREVPAVCGAFLASLEAEGRLGGGRVLGAFAQALTSSYLEAVSGKAKPIVRPGSKLGRNDPCPCGSGKKYKKCCMGK